MSGSLIQLKPARQKLSIKKNLMQLKLRWEIQSIRQEFECDWIANIEGSVYGDIIKTIEDNNQPDYCNVIRS